MRKLKLQVEELVVDSFEAVDNKGKAAGTVRGYDDSVDDTVCEYTHEYNISCQLGCTNECGTLYEDTCDGPTCNSPDCIGYQ